MARTRTITGLKGGQLNINISLTDGGVTKTTSVNNFTVNKTDITPTVSMSGYTYGGSLPSGKPSISGNTGNGTVTYYYNTTNSNSGGTQWTNMSSTSLNAGDYWMYAVVGSTDIYNGATTSTVKFTVSKATGNVGTASNPSPLMYRASEAYSFQLAMTGNTGTVTYPTSITVKNSSNNTVTGWSCTTAGVLTVPAGTNAGSYTVTGNVTCAASTNYNAVTTAQSRTWTITIVKADGNVGSVSNPASQTYKPTGTYSFQLAMTGNTGTVTYPTSITVKKGSTTISGWTCTSTGGLTVPAGTNAGTYTVTGNVTCAASTNYDAVTVGQGRTWTITIIKATPTFALLGNITNPENDTTSPSGIEYHGTAYVEGMVSVSGIIYWGTTSASSGMTNQVNTTSVTPTGGTYTIPITTRTALGTTTVYAYFVPSDTTNYNSLGSSSSAYASAAAKIIQSPDDDLEISVSGGTYTGNPIVIATVDSYEGVLITNNVPQYYLGYTVGGTSGTITWGSVGVNTISVTNAGTYYIHYKLTPDANHSTTHTDTILSNEPAIIEKADNPITVSPTTTSSSRYTLYSQVDEYDTHNKVQINVSNAVGTVSYSSSNTSVATVSSTGLVTYVANGNANITVTAAGNSNYYSGTKTVYITCTTSTITSYGDIYTFGPNTYPFSKLGASYTINPTSSDMFFGFQQDVNYNSGYGRIYSSAAPDNPFVVTFTAPTTTGFTLSTSNNGTTSATATVTATNNTTTSEREFTVTGSVTGLGGKTTTKTVTFIQSAGSKVYSGNPTVNTYTYSSSVSAGASTNLTPTVECKQAYTWNNTGDTLYETYNLSSSGVTWAFTRSGSAESWVTAGTNFATTGKINVASRGTTIGNARNFYSWFSVVATVTSSGNSSSSKTATAGTQVGNYVTAITPRASNGTAHFTYNNITAGATSASPTLTGAATYTYSSGSTSTSAPSSGTATYTRTYSLGTVQNGFTAVNQTTGVLTATSRGTTTGAARTSGTVTSVLTVTYTHASSYSTGGTVTSSTMTSTATCTQGANALESITLTTDDADNTIYFNGTAHLSVSASYTSGSTKDVTTSATYTTDPTGIVSIS